VVIIAPNAPNNPRIVSIVLTVVCLLGHTYLLYLFSAYKSTILVLKTTKLILLPDIIIVEGSDEKVEFSNRLKELRTQAGLTQLQLAQRLGITKSVISFYELSERAPSPDVLIRLAKIFHVSTDYLLGLDKKETLDISGIDKNDVALLRALADSLRKKEK